MKLLKTTALVLLVAIMIGTALITANAMFVGETRPYQELTGKYVGDYYTVIIEGDTLELVRTADGRSLKYTTYRLKDGQLKPKYDFFNEKGHLCEYTITVNGNALVLERKDMIGTEQRYFPMFREG